MGLLADIGRVLIKLSENESLPISNEDIQKIIRILRFIARGAIYGSYFALLGIGLASLYAGWLGMAVIMLVVSSFLFVIESNKLSDILGIKKKTQWSQLILFIGVFLIAIAVMSFFDSITTEIPKPISIANWEVWGIIGMLLTVGWLFFRFIRR